MKRAQSRALVLAAYVDAARHGDPMPSQRSISEAFGLWPTTVNNRIAELVFAGHLYRATHGPLADGRYHPTEKGMAAVPEET